MYEAKQQQSSKTLSKEWTQFYHALGTLNTSVVARALQDPKDLKEITDNLVMWCTIHAQECGPDEIFDWPRHACVRLTNPPPDGGGGVG